MRLSLLLIALCAGFASSAAAQVPQMLQVQPGKGTIGSVLRVSGTSLDKAKVDEVYLTDHTFDMKVKVLEHHRRRAAQRKHRSGRVLALTARLDARGQAPGVG